MDPPHVKSADLCWEIQSIYTCQNLVADIGFSTTDTHHIVLYRLSMSKPMTEDSQSVKVWWCCCCCRLTEKSHRHSSPCRQLMAIPLQDLRKVATSPWRPALTFMFLMTQGAKISRSCCLMITRTCKICC